MYRENKSRSKINRCFQGVNEHVIQFLQDSELAELRTAMDALKAQSIQAGIGTGLARQPSSDSVSSLSSACSLDKHEKKKKKGWV